MIKVNVTDHITPALNALSRSAGDILQQLIVEMSETLTPFLQQNAPVGRYFDLDGTERRGGSLRDSLRFVIGEWGAYLMGAHHGVYVIGGTKPHVIEPRGDNSTISTRTLNPQKPHLTFFWGRVGRRVTPQKVNHPGTKPDDFREKALQQAFDEQAIQNTASRVLAQWMNQIE